MMNKQEFLDKSIELFDSFHDHRCYIAGGSVRDFLLNTEIKDIDFYIFSTNLGEIEVIESKLTSSKYKKAEVPAYLANASVGGYRTTVWKKEDVDVMVVMGPTLNIRDYINKTYDVGLCMCFADKDGDIYTNNYFKKDKEDKTITFHYRPILTKAQVSRAIAEHIPRIQAKYVDYSVKLSYEPFEPVWSSVG